MSMIPNLTLEQALAEIEALTGIPAEEARTMTNAEIYERAGHSNSLEQALIQRSGASEWRHGHD